MKKLLLSVFLSIACFVVNAQNTTLKGKVIDSKSFGPLQDVTLTVKGTGISEISGVDGTFKFPTVPGVNFVLEVTYPSYKTQLLTIESTPGQDLDLGDIALEEDITSERQLSLITITENDLGDDNTGSESTSGLLQSSRDTYQQAAAFNWGQARFRIRGLDNSYGTTMINGVVMNKLYDGRPQWSNWGGLNDATRNQEFTMGSAPSDYNFGGILGTQEINTRASHYRTGGRVSFSGTNTNYNWRAMATYASGLNSKGWAFVVSGSGRWAEEGYFEGTDYNAKSLFASVEKKFNEKHSLNFTSIYAENSRGKSSPNTQEVTDLMGIDYNSYWGWQDGKKRNSRDKDIAEPINMLSHYWKITEKTSLNTNVAYQLGKIGNSRLDYQGVPNPDPTYYRNMPSYFLSLYENDQAVVSAQDPSAYLPGGLGGIYTPDLLGAYNAKFNTQQQIDWNSMYQANSVAGRSVYALYEDRTDDKQLSVNSVLNSVLSDNISLNAAVNYRKLHSHNFQNMLDLLGGEYYLDVDTYGDNATQTQSDLNNPNRIIYEGDKFGYNYKLYADVIDAFTQFKFRYKKVDFYLSQQFSRSEYQREGLYKNGYYPTNSYGKSEKVEFDNFGFKGGLTYKVNGRHLIDFNALYMSKAPDLRSSFSNARVNNNVTVDLKSETISGADLSYIIRAPKFKSRLTGFFSEQKNVTEVSFFFAEGAFEDISGGGDTDAFVNEVITGLNKKNYGLELGLEYQVTSTIKAMASASYGEYIYSNNPNSYLIVDAQASATNINPVTSFGKSHLKNYNLPGVPNTAASIGLEYRDPKFWWVGANYNYLSGAYLDISPLLRTDNFLKDPSSISGSAFPEATNTRVKELLKQEQFDDIYLLNLQGGKSWRISKKNRNTVGFFASVTNVLDTRYKTGGYEQARNGNYRELNQDVSSGNPAFAPKYFYGYGRTYFVNFYINF